MGPSETTIYHAVIIGSVLLAGLFIFLGIIVFRTQRRYFKAQQARFISALSLLEKERIRIARDLHDELGPQLSVTILLLAEAERINTEGIELLQQAQRNIASTNQRLGEIARNLTPQSLVSKGLDYALLEFLGQIEVLGRHSISYKYEVNHTISDSVSLQLFRMIQEIVNNALKHSEASAISVHLRQRNKKLYVLCRDNGKGMIENNIANNKNGLGIESLRSRAELLGSKMQISTTKGTEYFIEMPLNVFEDGKDYPISDRR